MTLTQKGTNFFLMILEIILTGVQNMMLIQPLLQILYIGSKLTALH